jgi:hypothetical protein
MKAKQRVSGCEAGNPTILLHTGSIAIEFRCHGASAGLTITFTGQEYLGDVG